jgi:hypothetical protein
MSVHIDAEDRVEVAEQDAEGAAVKCRTAAVDGGGRHGRRLEIRSSR